jgi:hypothetical protein
MPAGRRSGVPSWQRRTGSLAAMDDDDSVTPNGTVKSPSSSSDEPALASPPDTAT